METVYSIVVGEGARVVKWQWGGGMDGRGEEGLSAGLFLF